MNKQIFFLMLILSINLINALSVDIPSSGITNVTVYSNTNINSSNFWDNLDSPLDSWISTSNTTYQNYVTNNISNQTYNWVTANNGTFNQINLTWFDNVLGFLSFKVTQLETWFLTKLIDINNNINLNLTEAKTYTNSIVASNDTWRTNYSNYYNKSQVDYNFTLYMLISSWNTNLTNIFTQINNNYTSSLTTCNANINNNRTSINVDINNNLTEAKTYANSIVVSNDTWRTNYSSYLTGADVNSAIGSNLSLALLANGSRIVTGNMNFGGYNISNIDNLTSNKICNSTNCYVLNDFLSTTGDGSYNVTYHNYVTANISNQSYNWITSNNGTINGINVTWLDNVVGFLSFKLTQLESWFTGKLTDINTNINNNLTASKEYANSIVASNDTWRTNYTNYPTTTNMYSNLSNYLLANGSRALTGNWDVGGKNLTNINNITMTGKLSFGNGNYMQSNTTCTKIYGSTSLLEIC